MAVGPIDLVVQGLDPIQNDEPAGSNAGPYVGPTGHLFIFSNDAGSDGKIHAYRSTDGGSTWAEVDTANAPAYFSAGGFNANHYTVEHPSNSQRTCVIYITSAPTPGTPAALFTVLVKEFDLGTETWVAGTYGGNLPYTYPAVFVEQADIFGAVSRKTAAFDIVLLASNTSGATSLAQRMFVHVSSGGAWSVAINAMPGFPANTTSFYGAYIAATLADRVYCLTQNADTGEIYQTILSPTNIVSNTDIGINEFTGSATYPGTFPPVCGYVCASNGNVFLFMDYAPAIGNSQTIMGWVADGGDILDPFNIGAVTADSQNENLFIANDLVYLFFQDSTTAPFYITIDPTIPGTPSAQVSSTPLFPSISSPQYFRAIDSTTVGAIAFLSPIGLAHANFWTGAVSPAVTPVTTVPIDVRLLPVFGLSANMKCCKLCDQPRTRFRNHPMLRSKMLYAYPVRKH